MKSKNRILREPMRLMRSMVISKNLMEKTICTFKKSSRTFVKNIKKEEVSNDPPLDQDQMSAAEPVLEEAAENLESMQEEPRQEDITDNVDPMSSFLTDT